MYWAFLESSHYVITHACIESYCLYHIPTVASEYADAAVPAGVESWMHVLGI
jgi:hypothetical protein